MSRFDLTPPPPEQRATLEAGLSADERRVLLLDRPEFHRHSSAALRVAPFELYR